MVSTEQGQTVLNWFSIFANGEGSQDSRFLASQTSSFVVKGDRGNTDEISQVPPNLPDSGTTLKFLMRAIESGGSCVGNQIRYWVATDEPDTDGSQYTGTRCSPTPGTFSNFTILSRWTE